MKYTEWPKRPLSFTDCHILAICEWVNIKTLLTFDDEFNGLISIYQEI
ncbi:MAG: hypothetical protein OEY49_13565 [Candidatus Heimdallarchaeota archaeon]|nr:hypothetical protein [Candidatus Heimdallarchaeota archaeon]